MPLPSKPRSSPRASVLLGVFSLGAIGVSLSACGSGDDIGMQRYELAAKCSITVAGKGTKDMEKDYLPHVITCENGAADFEALKAQAVAARSYAYYVTRKGGSIQDGQSNQVYTCSAQPQQRHYDAVKATAGQVLRYKQTVICAFFVAGAKPSDHVGCVATSSDPDATHTEKYVTYNEGKSGNNITQSTLGWVNTGNIYNRGCQSQNGANCLSKAGRGYVDILRFYYGADIELYQTTGSCVTPPQDQGVPRQDQGVPRQDQGLPSPDQGVPRLDHGMPGRDATPSDDLHGGSERADSFPPPRLEAGTWPDAGQVEDGNLLGPHPVVLTGSCCQVSPGESVAGGVSLIFVFALAGLFSRLFSRLARRRP